MIYGPVYPGTGDINHLGTSLGTMYQLMTADSSVKLPPTFLPFFVDVRDVADAHRLAFELESENHPGRFLVSGGKYSNEVVRGFWETELGLQAKSSSTTEYNGLPESYQVDATRAIKLLRLTFRSFEQCFGDMGRSLLELQSLVAKHP